jgi:Mn-dependent DtxR family transcriptional regulator
MKRLSKTKRNILQFIWEDDKPLTLSELVEKTRLTVRTVRRHLNEMERTGLVKKSGYFITDEGKELIGFPPINEKIAQKVLRKTSPREAFYFYTDYGKPLAVSLEYHIHNGHFTAWIQYLGDTELAERINQLQNTVGTGEALRNTFYTLIKYRYDGLADKLPTRERSG